jgi:hemoglobin
MSNEPTVYELVGGDAVIRALVDTFYAKVEQDSVLRALFPEDLEPGKQYQYLFLVQLFGGPMHYGAERGHPRLRMRHAPFPIDEDAKERWLRYMLEAIDEVGIQDPARAMMHSYFHRAAPAMINRYDVEDDTHGP